MYFMKKRNKLLSTLRLLLHEKSYLLNLSVSCFCTDYECKYLNLKN
jgi:hypothetical protein